MMTRVIDGTPVVYAEGHQQCDDCGKAAELRPYGPNGSCNGGLRMNEYCSMCGHSHGSRSLEAAEKAIAVFTCDKVARAAIEAWVDALTDEQCDSVNRAAWKEMHRDGSTLQSYGAIFRTALKRTLDDD